MKDKNQILEKWLSLDFELVKLRERHMQLCVEGGDRVSFIVGNQMQQIRSEMRSLEWVMQS